MRKLAKILKNKKGFTLVEAIAVVAILGILATVIGGLVTAGTTAYMRQKENAAAKDLGTIVQNEIKRAARSTSSSTSGPAATRRPRSPRSRRATPARLRSSLSPTPKPRRTPIPTCSEGNRKRPVVDGWHDRRPQ